jgi:hypothetical protein
MGMSGSASFQGEEIQICRFRLGGVASHSVGTADFEMRQCSRHKVPNNWFVVEQLLEFSRCGGSIVGTQIGLAAPIGGIYIVDKHIGLAQFIGGCSLQIRDCRHGVAGVEFDGGIDRRQPVELHQSVRRIVLS